ncbi:hypothetical protein H3V53_35605 [Paraburkholderia bengalensis]|uniref:Uncharacterized protein n=1 Tax=Paraburkholderia bengalensis TaxID=2747562 RepID=A0ABU8J369_9BURK
MNELAVRSLMSRLKSDPRNLLQVESSKHQIRVDHSIALTDGEFAARRAQFYVLSVYQQAELFFADLVDDLPQGLIWKSASGKAARGKEEPQLDWIVRTIKIEKPDELDKERDAEFFDDVCIFSYFRLVRNAFMHEGKETRALGAARDALVKLHRQRSEELGAAKGNARERDFIVPNAYSELQFSDFILFTRVVKSIARRLCRALKPELDSLLEHRYSYDNHYGLRKYLNREDRFESACRTRLSIDYNLTEAEISYSIPKLKKLVAAKRP